MKKKGSMFTKQNVEIKAIIADKAVNKLFFFMVIIASVTMMMTSQFSCADRCDRERDCGFHIVTIVLPIITMTSRDPGFTTAPARIS